LPAKTQSNSPAQAIEFAAAVGFIIHTRVLEPRLKLQLMAAEEAVQTGINFLMFVTAFFSNRNGSTNEWSHDFRGWNANFRKAPGSEFRRIEKFAMARTTTITVSGRRRSVPEMLFIRIFLRGLGRLFFDNTL
jgi:hypothetical protein